MYDRMTVGPLCRLRLWLTPECECDTSLTRSTVDYTKGLVINYREGGGGGLQNGKIAGPKLFVPPPPPPTSRQGKTFLSPILTPS